MEGCVNQGHESTRESTPGDAVTEGGKGLAVKFINKTCMAATCRHVALARQDCMPRMSMVLIESPHKALAMLLSTF
jgi:hypothetical protein